jgi:hypothetical protein
MRLTGLSSCCKKLPYTTTRHLAKHAKSYALVAHQNNGAYEVASGLDAKVRLLGMAPATAAGASRSQVQFQMLKEATWLRLLVPHWVSWNIAELDTSDRFALPAITREC